MIKFNTVGMIQTSQNNPTFRLDYDVLNYSFITVDDNLYLVSNNVTGDNNAEHDILIPAGEPLNCYLIKAFEGHELIIDHKNLLDSSAVLSVGDILVVGNDGKLELGTASGVFFVVTKTNAYLTEQAVAVRVAVVAASGTTPTVKLYGTPGQNTDGSMTQKACTDAMKNVANLPQTEWTSRVEMSFSETETTAIVNNQTFVKVSDKAFTHDELDGATFLIQGGDRIELTSSMLTSMESLGYNGTFINLEHLGGNVVFCANGPSGDGVIPTKGTYLIQNLVLYAPFVTISYSDQLSANVMPIAFGTMAIEDGVTEMPDGVVYLQIGG